MDKLSYLVKEKFSLLPNEFHTLLESLLITDSEIVKKEKFKAIINVFKNNKDLNLMIDYETVFLTIFLLEVNRYFNSELINIFKSIYIIILDSKKETLVINIINKLIINSNSSEKTLDSLFKIRIKLFNSLTDFFKQYKLDIKSFWLEIFSCYLHILKEIQIKINLLTVDLVQPLIIFFKIFLILSKNIDNSNQEMIKLSTEIINELRIIIHDKEFPFFYRDIEFSVASTYLNLYALIKKKEDYLNCVDKILECSQNNIKKAFLYYKASYIYLPKDFYELKTDFIDKIIKLSNFQISSVKFENFFDFYNFFLGTETIFDAELTALINDIFIMIVKRCIQLDVKKIVEDELNKKGIVGKIFQKMKRDKFNFSTFDENYIFILELINAELKIFKKSIEEDAFKYLDEALKAGEKINRSECRIFIFLQKTDKENTILSDFLSLIFQETSVRSFNIIFEYFKILSDIFLKDKKNYENYNYFAKNYSEYFIKFLTQLDTKYLKLMNNLLINFEKFDKNFYGLMIFYFYQNKINNNENIKNEEYFNKTFSILFCLMKPYKNHKKILSLNKKNVIYKHNIFEKELTFEIPYQHLKWASYSNDRFLIIYMMDILIELDEPEVGFALIKNVMKYSLKNTYPESKSSLMKAFQVYFTLFFEKIQRSVQKKNGITENYEKLVFSTMGYLSNFINNNIFDRPPEILQPVLEIYYTILQNYELTLKTKIVGENSFIDKLNKYLEIQFFNNGICLSLISLLRNSWYFIRFYSFNILKNPYFSEYLWKIKDILLNEIMRDLLSLRHMETEGASNLFMLLSFHFGEKFYLDFSTFIIKTRTNDTKFTLGHNNYNNLNLNQKILEQISLIINVLADKYLYTIEQPNEKFNYNYSLHSFYIIMKSILEEEKLHIGKNPVNQNHIELFTQIINSIYRHLKLFKKYLVNNGVSEFSLENDSTTGGQGEDFLDYENKKMISIWYTTRFGNEALNLIFDIISSRAYVSLIYEYEEKTKFFRNLLETSIILMLDYHHMGVIETLNESVLKICKLLNYHENPVISNITFSKLEELLVEKLVREELSSILRRSAGLPYLITTLIKSYTSEDKFSYSKIKSILSLTITKLIENYKKYQITNSDASVHSLNILRIVVYDAVLKPYVKEFVDMIFLDLLDGLKSKNWSIKNSCMLLFSNIIKNLFHHSYSEKYIPTFVEYFCHKEELKSKIYNLITDETSLYNNDCLILLLNFFSKFKKTKNNEFDNIDLKRFIQVLFNLKNHNNNFVRKANVEALFTLYGSKVKEFINIVKDDINLIRNSILANDETINNNSFDFLIEFLKKLLNSKEYDLEQNIKEFEGIFTCVKEIFLKLNFLGNIEDKNYIYFYNISKFLNVAIKKESLIKNHHIKNNIIEIIQSTDLTKYDVLAMIKQKSSIPFFYKALKNIIKLYLYENVGMFLDKFSIIVEKYLLDNFNPSKDLALNEIFTFYLSKFHKYYIKHSSKSIISILVQGKIFEDINITSKLLECLIKTKFLEVYSSKEVLSISSILLNFIEKNPSITKLGRKILLLLSDIYSFPLKQKGEFTKNLASKDNILNEINSFITCIKRYSLSHNEEKLRFNSLTALNTIITSLYSLTKEDIIHLKSILMDNNNKELLENIIIEVLLIFIFTLNDEHPEIRIHASKIYNNFNKISPMLSFSPFFNSEYIIKKLITQVGVIEEKLNTLFNCSFNNIRSKFYSFLLNENIYFNKVNSQDKVFYFEPDNRFIDNIQIKTDIFNTLIEKKIPLNLLSLENSSNISKNGIMMMLEDFTEIYKEKIKSLIKSNDKSHIDYQKFRVLIYSDLF